MYSYCIITYFLVPGVDTNLPPVTPVFQTQVKEDELKARLSNAGQSSTNSTCNTCSLQFFCSLARQHPTCHFFNSCIASFFFFFWHIFLQHFLCCSSYIYFILWYFLLAILMFYIVHDPFYLQNMWLSCIMYLFFFTRMCVRACVHSLSLFVLKFSIMCLFLCQNGFEYK